MKKIVVDALTNTQTEVEMTAAEVQDHENDLALVQSQQEAKAAEAAQKATDKTNGNQKLLDLGLTQAEVDAITGQ